MLDARCDLRAGYRPMSSRPLLRGGTHSGSRRGDRKSTRLNSSHLVISYAVFCLKKKNDYADLVFRASTTDSNDGSPGREVLAVLGVSSNISVPWRVGVH